MINELNSHSDLAQKLSSQSKICKLLEKDSKEGNETKDSIKKVEEEINRQKNEFGKLGFLSKTKLGMKNIDIDPRVREIMGECKQKLETLKQEKDEELEDFLDEHAENKFKATMEIKKKFKLKIAFA